MLTKKTFIACGLSIALVAYLLGATSAPQLAFTKTSAVQHSSVADFIFLRDSQNKEWIFKQLTETSPDDQIVLVLEEMASEIARTLNISLNHAEIVAASDWFEHRLLPNFPGTLHLRVPGASVEDNPPWVNFSIQQRIRSPFQIARMGPLPSEVTGLTKEVIDTMSKHPDLPRIVALDTFLGNNDRSAPNVFYDAKGDRFYGIDMGSCLIGNLAQCAHEKILLYSAEISSLSTQELQGLVSYRKTLQSLTEQFPPANMISLLDQLLKKAGFTPNNSLLWNKDVERKLKKWKLAILENYNDSIKLVNLLQELERTVVLKLTP